MATQLWNKEIDKTVDWGGDTSTGGQPVSGQFVQKFIKDTLASKFGYLHYNSDTKKYQVFADESDFNIWNADPATNANLLLATFDAPAPATIKVEMLSDLSNTILSSSRGNVIKFKYTVNDSSNSPITESVTVRLQVTNNGITQTYTFPYGVDYVNYKDGTVQEINIDEYLSVGTNLITLNFTGVTTQASAVANVRYTVVSLKIESGWDNTVAQEYDETMNPDILFDSELGNALRIPFIASGQGAKYIEIYINGEEFKQSNGVSSKDLLSGQQEYNSRLDLFLCNANGTLKSPFVEGKNTIQFRIYIYPDGNVGAEPLYSNTLYYEFVIRNKSSVEDLVYILYKQELTGIFDITQTVEFNAQQYFSTSFDYSVYSSTGKSTGLSIDLDKRAAEGEAAKKIATLLRQINSGESQTFTYSFLDYGVIDILITTDLKDASGRPLDTLHVIVNVEKAAEQISVIEDGRILNFDARNRSNSEPNPDVWTSGAVKAEFENIYWNESAGWDTDKGALVLNNGAMCTIPYNIFGTNQNEINQSGLTIEITFEMTNVQEEEAVMLTFESEGNTSSIKMTAAQATITDGSGNNVHTNYNANTKIKIAFVINPYDSTNNFNPAYTQKNGEKYQEYKNSMFIMVNGILDRAAQYSGKLTWNANSNPKLIIGNKEGKAGINIYSIRTYRTALSLDNELTNFMAEYDEILKIVNKNKIYEEGTNNVSLDIVKNKIPTVVIYGDIDAFNKLPGKKENMEFDMEFYDPTDPDRDFYARGCWFSNQGTSSLSYPIRNLRPYFSKTVDSKTVENTAKYYTEVYLAGEFEHGSVSDEEKLGNFYTNAKTCKDGYHRLYNGDQADKLQKEGVQLFYAEYDSDGKAKYIPCTKGTGDASDAPAGYGAIDSDGKGGWFIQAYREIKAYGPNKTDDVWKFLKDLRMSGCKIYNIASTEEVENPNSGKKYPVNKFEQVKGKKALKQGETYFLAQAAWKQYEKSGYTDRWTFKADYAESTMTQNAGVGRLWGDCMKNVQVNGTYACRTNAQTAVGNKQTADDQRIDIRTSCDGKPIVGFCCPLKYDESGKPVYVNGRRQYDSPIFIGLYNIMTDKSSTKLFGFENIYDETGALIYKADRTECFECLSNATDYAMGLSVVADSDPSNTSMGHRSLWGAFEARWPDVKVDDEQTAHTQNLESLWRFINYCKEAVDYKVFIKDSDSFVDGYTLSPYSLVDSAKFDEYWEMQPRPQLYTMEIKSGNFEYTPFEAKELDDWKNNAGRLYEYQNNFDYDRVYKELSGKRIEGHIYKGQVAGFDAKHGIFLEDIQFDEERVDDPMNGIAFGDAIAGTPVETDYYVNVYLTQNGNTFRYVNEHGETVNYTGSVDREEYEKDANGQSYAGKTLMQYFSDKKYDYFDIPKLAAYYIYLIRFAAADQFVKNSMLATEDGQHYYYINYDNDTVLGTRNDGSLVFHWTVNRDTYDYETSSFCFAGAKSVLWNLLEMDDDFMKQVKTIDNAMYSSNVLSASIALHMFNDLQEGSWGERMYNLNEKYKYLSQYKGDDDKYLAFIHGSANQFRSWFVENRFNYYDSLWESGEYLTTKITFYIDTIGTDGQMPMLAITAARQNKFFLSNSDGRYKDVAEWKYTLKQGETKKWPALFPIYGNSSPWSLYGCDKIETLDWRDTIGVFSLQKIAFDSDGTDWMNSKNKGTLMTRFLIGTSDEFRRTDMFNYTNVSEESAVLMNVTLTNKAYETTIDAPYDETKVKKETVKDENGKILKYQYTAIGNEPIVFPLITVAAGESYALEYQLSEYDNTKFEMNLLTKTQCEISQLGGLGKMYALEEVDIRNCFNEADPITDLDISKLYNLHIYRAIGSSITSFEPAYGAILNEVSLPENRINTIILDNVTLKAAEGQTVEVFKYKPDIQLTNATFNNVTFDDSNPAINYVEFINEWIRINEESNKDLKGLSLTLNGVNIPEASVDWVIKLKKLNLLSFTGRVRLVGTGTNGRLTEEEYNTINEIYAAERPFEPTSALIFDAPQAVYWRVENAELVEESLNLPNVTVNKYYRITHGRTLNFKVTKFPITNVGLQKYNFDVVTGSGSSSKWTSGTVPQNSEDKKNSVYAAKSTQEYYDLRLTPSISGNSTFISQLTDKVNSDKINSRTKYVRIYTLDSDLRKDMVDGDELYVEIIPSVLPEKLQLYFGEDILPVRTDNVTIKGERTECDIYTLELDEPDKNFEVRVKYSNADAITVFGKVPTANGFRLQSDTEGFGDEPILSNNIIKIDNFNLGNINTGGYSTFNVTAFINPALGTVAKPLPNVQNVLIDMEMITDLTDNHRKAILEVKVKTKMPNKIVFGELEGAKIEQTDGEVFNGKLDTFMYYNSLKNNSTNSFDKLYIPLKGVIDTGETPNVPIYSIDSIEAYTYTVNGEEVATSNVSTSIFKWPKYEKVDGESFIVLEHTNGFSELQSYDYEYEFTIKGKFGYETASWEGKLVDFTFNCKLDVSVIYPNAYKIVYLDDESIEVNNTTHSLSINTRDGNSKDITLKVVPYNTMFKDPITVEMTKCSITVNLPDPTDEEKVFLDDGFTLGSFITKSKPNFENGLTYPTIEFTINKYNDMYGVEDRIQYILGSISVSGEYEKSTKPVENVVDIKIAQSIASASIIDDCVPYLLDSLDETSTCDWYLVDSDNQYYTINGSIWDELANKELINKIVGVAKRINYGWDDPKKIEDPKDNTKVYPFTGNCDVAYNQETASYEYIEQLNNACLYWKNDPNICIENKNTGAKNVYYRALCIPFANWQVPEELFVTKLSDSTNTSNVYKELNKVSAFFIPMCRFFKWDQNKKIDSPLLEKIFKNFSYEDEGLQDVLRHGKSFIGVDRIKTRPIGPSIIEETSKDGKVTTIKAVDTTDEYPSIGGTFPQSSFIESKLPTMYIWEQLGDLSVEDIWGTGPEDVNNAWELDGNSDSKRSAVVDVWNHFKLYKPMIDPELKYFEENENIKCYIPSPWELNHLMVGNIPSLNDVSNMEKLKPFKEIVDALNFGINENGSVDRLDMNKVFANVLINNYQTVYQNLGNTNVNDWFTDNDITATPNAIQFGSLELLNRTSITGVNSSNNAITLYRLAKNDEKGVYIKPERQELLPAININNWIPSNGNYNSNYYLFGNQNGKALWIPLLIVD